MKRGRRGGGERKRERERVAVANNSGLNLFCREWKREARKYVERKTREKERTRRRRKAERTNAEGGGAGRMVLVSRRLNRTTPDGHAGRRRFIAATRQ